MGGIKEIGVMISCDKCRKDVTVNDPGHVSFYKAHAARADASRNMFISLIMDMSTGKDDKTAYEWLCPPCSQGIANALRGTAPKIEDDGVEKSGEAVVSATTGKRRGRPPKIAVTATVVKAAEPGPEPQDIPDRDQGPGFDPPAAESGGEVDDNELFD